MKILSLSLILLSAFAGSLQAQQAELEASTKSPRVGEPFVLRIKAEGQRVGSPGILDIPGIAVLSQSKSTSMSIINGQVNASTSFNFQVVAESEGPLEIAGIALTVNGNPVKTNGLKLNVLKGSSAPQPPHLQPRLGPGIPAPSGPNTTRRPPPGQTGQSSYPAKIDEETAFLRVEPIRDAIYVGETAEVEIKAYLDAGIPIVDFARELSLQGEDFIFQPTVGPDAQMRQMGGRRTYQFKQETIDGRRFNVLTYRTTMTAVKPGTFTLAPVDFTTIIQLPPQKRRQTRPRSLLDSVFGDPFDDPFFDSMMSNRRRELRLQSKPVEIKVLSLPTEGRPDNFQGAIGRFSFDVKVDKEAMEVDEALKMTATITGYGNFERIGELDMAEDPRWKSYPPKIQFNSADDLNLSGEKLFEYTWIAAAPATASPTLQFSFFDPEEKRYVSLGGTSLPVAVTGAAASALTNEDLAALADQVADPARHLLAAIPSSQGGGFFRGTPPYSLAAGSLLLVNGSAAAVALCLFAWQWRRRDRPPTPKRRHRLLLRERASLLSALHSETDAERFGQALLRWLAVQERLRDAAGTEMDDGAAARRTVQRCPAGTPARHSLEEFLDWVNVRQWASPDQARRVELSVDRRKEWLQAVQSLQEESGS